MEISPALREAGVAYRFGVWYAAKVRRAAAEFGVYQAARNLRKQGVPLEHALALLASARRDLTFT